MRTAVSKEKPAACEARRVAVSRSSRSSRLIDRLENIQRYYVAVDLGRDNFPVVRIYDISGISNSFTCDVHVLHLFPLASNDVLIDGPGGPALPSRE